MIRIVYVVSTLERMGPTKQLLGIVKYLDKQKFEPIVVTLSPEGERSMKGEFESCGVDVKTLGLGRIGGLVFGKFRLEKVIEHLGPDVIHTQGIRADRMMLSVVQYQPWLCTSRNYPFMDYPMKFGGFKGALMARAHMAVFGSGKSKVVACSEAIQKQLDSHSVNSVVIRNGVEVAPTDCVDYRTSNRQERIVIVVGSLIARKRVELILDAFSHIAKEECVKLVVLGDGPLLKDLKGKSCKRVEFTGDVIDVSQYLADADLFVSASTAEGFPNAVLEALSAGVPCLLSDIAPHQELTSAYQQGCALFSGKISDVGLADRIVEELKGAASIDRRYLNEITARNFSVALMSQQYQDLYNRMLP